MTITDIRLEYTRYNSGGGRVSASVFFKDENDNIRLMCFSNLSEYYIQKFQLAQKAFLQGKKLNIRNGLDIYYHELKKTVVLPGLPIVQ